MTLSKVIVVGAGVAGTAAAWSAHRRGAAVTVVRGPAGASELSGGAIDDDTWTARPSGPVAALAADVADFVAELGIWCVPPPPSQAPRIATAGGIVRACRGHDQSLLDLASIEPGIVAVPRADRPGWDADALAAAFDADPWARERGLSFRAVDFIVLRHHDEHSVCDADVAARHDDEARRDWLAARLVAGLRRRHGGISAILLGPWLGATAPCAPALSKRVGVPVGEALVAVGSPAGLRFAAARDRLLAKLGVTVRDDRAESIGSSYDPEAPLGVRLASGETISATCVVLAIGGVAAGGIVYTPPRQEADEGSAPAATTAFAASVAAPVELAARGERLDVVSSMHGPDLEEIAWPTAASPGLLECVGIRCDGVVAAKGITVAGDAIADRPRTVIAALVSGIAAGA